MIQVDLITGFLGAGKTTFLLRYARYLMQQGLKIGILVYDHGAVNVDLPLLRELRGASCELEMLAGGCDADCHRRRFRTKLIAMGMSGYDRVIIEPSGVFDMDEFFDTLREQPLDRWYEPGSVISIVDAKLEADTTDEEDFFLASQAACAGRVLLSRCQLATAQEIEETRRHLLRACETIHAKAPEDGRVIAKAWDDLGPEDYAALLRCGCRAADYVKPTLEQAAFQALSFLNLPLSGAELEDKLRQLFGEERFGRILRVKGFFREGDSWFQLNATKDRLHVEAVPENRSVLLVIGSGLDENAIHILLTGRPPEHPIL